MIRCEYTLTWKLYESWVREDQLRGRRLVLNVLLLVLGAACLLLAFPLNFLSAMEIGLFLMSVYVVFFNWRQGARNQYRRAARSCGGENWTRVVTFGESAVTFSDGPSRRTLPYGDLTGIVEKPDRITLLFGKKGKLMLYPDSFTQGSWSDCREILRRESSVKLK